jgi:hypothetical protein
MRLWRTAIRSLTTYHETDGRGVVFLHSAPDSTEWELVGVGPALTIKGKKLDLKKVRQFLWDHRKARRNFRPNAVLWSWYNPTIDVSVVGLGAFVRPTVAERRNLREQ